MRQSDVASTELIHESQQCQSAVEGVAAFYSYQAGNFTASEGFPYVWKQTFVRKGERD
jgi:hypothetical protein